MTSRPTQGGSPGTWGTQLDAYLDQFVDSSGALVPAAVRTALGGSTPVSASTLGAVADGQIVSDGAITSGQAALTSATGRFTAADVGKLVSVIGAGAAAADLITTISAYVSATQVTLAATAGTTVTGAEVVWGTDSTAAIVAAYATVGTVVFPSGNYLLQGNPIATGATRIIGLGNVTFQLVGTTTVGPTFDHSAGFPLTGASMENILVRGDGGTLGTGSQVGIRLKNAIRVSLSHTRVSSCSIGIDLYNDAAGFCERNDIEETCHVNNCGTGIRFYSTATGSASFSYNRFDDIGIDDCRIGIDCGGASATVPTLNSSAFVDVVTWLQRNGDIGIVLNADMDGVFWQGAVERLGGSSTVGMDVRSSAANLNLATFNVRFLSVATNIQTSSAQVAYALGLARYVKATGTRISQEHYADGDANPFARVSLPSGGGGRFSLGPGGATAVDAFIYRSAAGEITTDGAAIVNEDGSTVSRSVFTVGKSDTTGRWQIQSGGSPTTRRVLRGYSGTTETITLDPNSGIQVTNVVKQGVAAPAYSASITPAYTGGSWQTITVTNGTAFTINAPTSPPDASHSGTLVVEILNSSGGAMGVITWNAVFVFAGATWANPASTKKRFARFEWNGAAWVCTGIAAADY